MKAASFVLICSVCQWLVLASPSEAYYPGDPEVQAMVSKGVKYLEGLSNQEIATSKFPYKPDDHIILIAYAHLKAKHNPDAALVKQGVQRAKQLAKDVQARSQSINRNAGVQSKPDDNDKTNYALSIAIILLCEVDAQKHKSDIEGMRNLLLSRQQPDGGFGYPFDDHGDTSQTQYVVLAVWSMKQNGIGVDPEPVNRVHQWLMRVQDEGGAWPYIATDPGPDKGLIKQNRMEMSHSTALAGASSILIAADFFGLWRGGKSGTEVGVLPGMPLAVKLPNESEKAKVKIDPSKATVRTDKILESVERMNSYRREVPYDRSGSTWHYYAMYSLERFESFYAMVSDNESVDETWYDDGVEKLKANQAAVGGWGIKDNTSSPPPVATAFAILFLVRSTQQSIAASTGTLAGGQGLPKDTTDIKVSGTQITGRPVAAEVGKMLDLLEDDEGDLEGKSIPDDLELAADPKERRAQIDRLERLLRGSQSWQARRVAARLLGKSEQMRVVPTLIYALSDPDTSVRRYARDGLRFISRKFEGFGLSDQPSDIEIQQVQEKWRQWYLKVNPKYVFIQD